MRCAVTSVDVMVDGTHFRLGPACGPAGRRAGARWRARCRTSRRWAPPPARPTWRSCCPPSSTTTTCWRCTRGAEALAARCGVTIAGGDLAGGPGADDRRHRGRLGRRGRPPRRARRCATGRPGGRHRVLWEARRPASRCSRDAPRAPARWRRYLRPVPRIAAGRALAAAGRDRDARPLRRPGVRRARLAEASGVRARARRVARCRSRRAWRPWRGRSACCRPSWRRRAARTTSCAPACRPAAGEAAGLTWIGEVSDGEPGLRWVNAPAGAETWKGFEHRL